MISDFQKRKLTHFFYLLDVNKNDYLQLEDFSIISDNLIFNLDYEEGSKEHKFIADKSVAMFYRFSADISGTGKNITLKEWLDFFDQKIIAQRDKELLEEYVELIIGFLFDLFDANHDGYISIEEYTDIFMAYGIDIKYAAKAFVNLDINQDDRLSKSEILYAVETFLISNDPNERGNWIFGNWDIQGAYKGFAE